MKRSRCAAWTAAFAWLAISLAHSASAAAPATLRDAAFLTCTDVNAMPSEERKALGLQIATAAANYFQTQLPDSEQVGEQIGWLIRSGCTIAPESYFSTVVARAVRVMGGGITPPLRQPLDMNQAIFLTCAGTDSLSRDQLEQVGSFIGKEAAAHYGLTPGLEWTPDYVAALVHNGCKMYPDAFYLGMVGRAVRAMSARTK